MIGVFVFFIVYLVFGLLNKKKNKDQRKLFYVCSSAIGLSFFLYFFEGQLTNYSFFSLGALFFLLNGCGLMRLLKLNKRYIYNHYYPFLTFSILYLFTDLIGYKGILDGFLVNNIMMKQRLNFFAFNRRQFHFLI